MFVFSPHGGATGTPMRRLDLVRQYAVWSTRRNGMERAYLSNELLELLYSKFSSNNVTSTQDSTAAQSSFSLEPPTETMYNPLSLGLALPIILFPIICYAFNLHVYLYMKSRPLKLRMPPGPKGLPILGSLLDLPPDRYWLKIDEWVKKHGPIITIKLLGKRVVVLGSAKVAADLLDRRSAIYSDRPRWVLSSEILARNMHVGVIRVGERHRRFRKAIHAGLQPKALASYHTLEEHEARVFVKEVSQNPDAFRDCAKRFAAALILRTTYGHSTLTLSTDRFAQRVFSSATNFAGSLAPGKFLVDILPWLQHVPRWIPGAGWQKKAAEWAENDRVLYIELLQTARENAVKQPSFISEGLLPQEKGENLNCDDEYGPYGVTEEELAYIGGTISQTADTIMSTVSTLLLALTSHPAVLSRAQAEVDSVVGRSRWPTFADREKLPYVGALAREVCRWRPVAPLSVPHASTKDDMYNGYFIPAGTTVISCTWSIHHDPAVYADPSSFNPSRFLDANGKEIGTEEAKERGHHVFGFGRRMCPGATMSDHAIFIFAACIIWALDMRPVRDRHGVEIIPPVDPLQFSSGGEASHPLPFPSSITLRSGVQELLEDVPFPGAGPD